MIILNKDNFKETIQKSETPVLVDFWAQWCPPCCAFGPVLEKVEKEYQGKFTLGKVDIDENPELAEEYQADRIPTIILFEKGSVKSRFCGSIPEDSLKEWLDQNL